MTGRFRGPTALVTTVPGRLSILLVSAIPDSEMPFRSGRKTRALRTRLSPLIEQGNVVLAVEPAITLARLDAAIKIHRPQILHVLCHTVKQPDGKFVLALEDDRGERDAVGAKKLASVLASMPQPFLKLVILEACASLELAATLTSHCPSLMVIGTREAIVPRTSTRFFLSLHAGLALGHSIRRAFDDAQSDMELLAPSMWGVAQLMGPDGRAQKSMATAAAAASFHIDPNAQGEAVAIADPLAGSRPLVGREALIGMLDEEWFGPADKDVGATTNLVHLRGPAGVGKTALLARWLELHRVRAYCGATRVFAWSFDPLAKGEYCGTEAEFLRAAFDFFGGVQPYFKAGAGEPDHDGPWLAGLRLARLVRQERALLCLDGVPTKPGAASATAGPYSVFDPGIAALLHELGQGHAGLCVFSTRCEHERAVFDAVSIEVPGLSAEQAQALLEDRHVIDLSEQIHALATNWHHDPLALALAATALSNGCQIDPNRRVRGERRVVGLLDLDIDSDASAVLSLLALHDGVLDLETIRLLLPELPRPPEQEAAEPPSRAMRAVRALLRRGLIRGDDQSVRLRHGGIATHAIGQALSSEPVLEHMLRRIKRAIQDVVHVPLLARGIRLALAFGDPQEAITLYGEHVCRIGPAESRLSDLSRHVGTVTGTLTALSEFFVPDAKTGIGLQPRSSAVLGHADLGLLHHHAGRALRHLGEMAAARPHFELARGKYDQARDEERSAICANDLAEALVWCDELPAALRQANEAVGLARSALQKHRAKKDEPPGNEKRFLVALFVCLGTRGYVRLKAREFEGALKDFVEASRAVHKANETSPEGDKHLFSRPGYYYALSQFEELGRASSEDDRIAILTRLAEWVALAEPWHRSRPFVAQVSRGFDAVVRGRVLLESEKLKLPCPDLPRRDKGRREIEEAFVAFSYAIHVFRANQHLWMLPEVLDLRADVHDYLGDPGNAKRDREEATQLRDFWGRGQ